MSGKNRIPPPITIPLVLLIASAICAQPQSPNFLMSAQTFSAGAAFDSSAHFTLFSSFGQWSPADTNVSPNYRVTSGFLTPSYGAATGAFLAVNPSALNFGNVHVDSLSRRTIALSDTGVWNLIITGMEFLSNLTYEIVPPPQWPDTVPALGSREYSIQFHPTMTGTVRDTLVITPDFGPAVRIGIEGTGIAPAIAVEPDSLICGDLWIGRAQHDTISVLNPGSADLHVDSITSSNPVFPPVAALSVSPGGRLDLPYSVTLPETLNYVGTLTAHSDAGNPTVYVSAHGVWTELRAFPAAIALDSVVVGDSVTVTDTLRSIGNHSISLQQVYQTNYRFTLVRAPVNFLQAYGYTTLDLRFRPTQTGDFLDTLVIVNELGSDLRIPLQARGTSAAGERTTLIPKDFFLDQNFPNPFNPTTTIRFGVPKTAEVTLDVFDILGRRVTTLVSATLQPGIHTVMWDCSACPSGMYLIRMSAGQRVFLHKMLLMK